MSKLIAQFGKTCHTCSHCGKIEISPYDCPRGGQFDDTVEDEKVVDGKLQWHGYCDKANEYILLCMDMDRLDASNAASYLKRWAKTNGHNISIEWGVRNDKDVILLFQEGEPVVLGRRYSDALEKLNNILKE